MLNFKPSKVTLALLSSGVMALSAAAYAEEATEKKTAEQEVEVIQITGFRGSIIESINTKRYSSEVVEAISAEDIGKLPDLSIADSLARLPGARSQGDVRVPRPRLQRQGHGRDAQLPRRPWLR